MSTPFILVVSDTHLSAGPPTGENPLEDFTSDHAFAALLDDAAAESEAHAAPVDLILNGDTFEMLQVPHVDVFDPAHRYLPSLYHGTTAAESVQKVDLVIAGHPVFFDALRRFLHPRPPRRSITFVTGNHDLNLHWPSVQERIRQAIDARRDRAPMLSFEPRVTRRDGVYVEHGNQYSEFVNRVPSMENPVDPARPDRLVVPPGSWFVTDFFNDVERNRYWIDGVKPITALVFYALAYDFPFAARALSVLLRALPGIVLGGLGVREAPTDEALADRLEDPASVAALAAQYEEDPAFRASFNVDIERAISPPITARPRALRDAPLGDSAAMGERLQGEVHSALYEAASRIAIEEGVAVVTFGHTHEPGVEALPGGAVYVNTGTWTWRGDFTQAGTHTWRDLFTHPERFTGNRDLTYLRVDYDDTGRPVASLRERVALSPRREMGLVPAVQGFLARLLAWLRATWAQLRRPS